MHKFKIINRSYHLSVELQNQNPGTDLRTEMLTTGSGISKDEVDFFDQSGKDVEVRKLAPTEKFKHFWRYSIIDIAL